MTIDLLKYVMNIEMWDKKGDVYVGTDNSSQIVEFTKKELNQLNKKLAPFLDYAIANSQYPSRPHDLSPSVKLSLEYWQDPSKYTKLQDCDGRVFLVSDIYEIDYLDGEDFVVFDVQCLALKHFTKRRGESFTKTVYVEDSYRDHVSVPKTWMDHKYPGWKERLLTMQALGSPLQDLVSQVLTVGEHHIKASVELGDIKFD